MTKEEEIYKQSVELFGAVDKQPKNFEGVFSKRQLDIAKEAEERYLSSPLHQYYSAEDLAKAFRDGAEWADMYPVNVWHDASKFPNKALPIIIEIDDDIEPSYEVISIDETDEKFWEFLVSDRDITMWAYVKDLLPKGGEL